VISSRANNGNPQVGSEPKRTFGPVDVPGAGVAVAETDNSGIDMGKDAVIAFHEERVRGDNLIFQLLGSLK
jgi:hypothetical protein